MVRGLFMVEVRVGDFNRSVAWYRGVLGLNVVVADEANGFALLSAVGGGTRLALKAGRPQPGGETTVWEVDDLSAALERLTTAGVEVEGPVKASDEGYRRAFVRDPDGYRVGLFEWAGN